MIDQIWLWIGFNAFILAMLALDFGVFHRKSHVVSLKESLAWSGVWVALALVFNAGVWHYAGPQKAFVAIAAALAILAMGFVWAQRCLGGCASGSKHAPQTSRRVSAAGRDALPLTS
jgi:peptidoglycan/LPS O-acetylase OafA/YrhL